MITNKLEELILSYKDVINNNKRHFNKMYAEDLRDAVIENMTLEGVIDDIENILKFLNETKSRSDSEGK